MKAVEAMKDRAVAALHDVTHLPDRREGHPDLVKDRLQYKRITLKSLLRAEFAVLAAVEQEAYVYRLARCGNRIVFLMCRRSVAQFFARVFADRAALHGLPQTMLSLLVP